MPGFFTRVSQTGENAVKVNRKFSQPLLNSLMYLNELSARYSKAISLGSGRPEDRFCQPLKLIEYLPKYFAYLEKNQPQMSPIKRIAQYGPAAGFIRELIAKHLEVDEKILVKPEDIVVTLGFQEAADLCGKVLFEENDVVIIPDPIFVGMAGSALINNVAVETMNWDGEKFVAEIFEKTIQAIKAAGKNPKAMYVIPDFNNPHGTRLSLESRKQLIQWALEHNILLIEDNPYGIFNYKMGSELPSLKALCSEAVIYIGSTAKTVYPTLRIGYIVTGQAAKLDGKPTTLSNVLAQAKSFTTVNTPGLDQALFAALLLQCNFSLKNYCEPQIDFNRRNLQVALNTLQQVFGSNPAINWNQPDGGYFITINLPFAFGLQEMAECAKLYNVIVVPVTLLSMDPAPRPRIRISFVNVPPEELIQGIKNFADYVAFKLAPYIEKHTELPRPKL